MMTELEDLMLVKSIRQYIPEKLQDSIITNLALLLDKAYLEGKLDGVKKAEEIYET